jgi:ribosomal protein S18 acetylase RimI-like enzyme
MKEYKLGRAEEKDIETIWAIRNHPLVRKNSGSSSFITLQNHKKWFRDKYFENKNNFCYVLCDGSRPVGYCRFDYNEKERVYIISIARDPENKNRGLGTILLSKSMEKIRYKKNDLVLAEIRKDNIASIKLFEKNGFKKYGESEEVYKYKRDLND